MCPPVCETEAQYARFGLLTTAQGMVAKICEPGPLPPTPLPTPLPPPPCAGFELRNQQPCSQHELPHRPSAVPVPGGSPVARPGRLPILLWR